MQPRGARRLSRKTNASLPRYLFFRRTCYVTHRSFSRRFFSPVFVLHCELVAKPAKEQRGYTEASTKQKEQRELRTFARSRLSFSDLHLRWTLSYLTTGPGPLSAGQPCPQTKKKQHTWAFSSWEHAKAKGGSRSPIFLFFLLNFFGNRKGESQLCPAGCEPCRCRFDR